MKMLSFRTMAMLFATTLTIASANGFAHKHHHHSSHSSSSHGHKPIQKICDDKKLKHEIRALKLKLAVDQIGIYGGVAGISLNSIFTTWGFSPIANPLLDDKLQGSIDQNYTVILANIDLLIAGLGELGIPPSTLTQIHDGAIAYVDALIAYCSAVNMNNRGGGGGDEAAIVAQLLALAQSNGQIFATLIGNNDIIDLFVQGTELIEQEIQAWAGVLNNPAFGAIEGDLYSQSAAAVKIQTALQVLAEEQRTALFESSLFN